MSLDDISPHRESRMRQVHKIADYGIPTNPAVYPAFVRIIGHSILSRRFIRPTKPAIPWFVGQKYIERAILLERVKWEAIPDSKACENVVPFEFRSPDALSLDILRTPNRSDEIIESKDQRPIGERAESNRIIEIIDHARKGSSESSVIVVPIAPYIYGAEGEHFLLTRPIGNPVHTEVQSRDTAAVARGNVNLLSKQGGAKLLAGFGGLLFSGKRTQWKEDDHKR